MQNGLHARVRAVNIWLMAPLLGLAVFMAVFAAVRPAQAATSSYLNFQARLLTSSGAVVPDGSYNIDFKIYNADSTTGTVGTCTGACLWEETRTNAGGHGVQVINGYFSVNLGSVTAFPATINWDQPLWLTMNITTNGTQTTAPAATDWNGEMQNSGHSISLTALPYSFVAGQLAKTDSSGHRGVLGFNTVTNNPNLTLPDVASGTLCIQGSTACNFINNQTSVQTANFNIQSAATGSVAAVINGASGQTVDLLDIKNSTTVLSIGNNGQTLLKPTAGNDSTAFFQVQNAASSKDVFTVDTTNGQIVLGNAGASGVNGTIVFNNSAGTGTATLTLAANPTASYTYQLPVSSVASGQCLQSGTVSGSTVPLTFGLCGASGTFLNKNSTDTSTFTGLGAGAYGYTFTNNTSPANSSGVLSLNNGSNTGTVLSLQGTSTSALQVENSSSQRVLGVDTSNKQTILGQSNTINGALLFQNSTSANGITINSTATSSNYTLTLPTAAPAGGLCIETSPGDSQQLIFASCTNNNASIQEVHYWDASSTNVIASVTPTTIGDEMVVTTQIPNSGVTVQSISGGGVTTWSKVVASSGNGTVNRVELWVGTVTSLTTSNIAITYTGGTASGEEVTATEFTAAGVNASTSWGIESSASQLNSTASATVTFPSATAVNGSELYVGYAQVSSPPATAGSSTGFSYIQTSTQHNIIAYDTSLAANTTYQPTANQTYPPGSGESNSVDAVLTAFVTSSSINNTTSLQKANFYVQAASSGTVAGVLQAASSGSADILDLRNSGAANVLTVGSTGNVAIQPAASATAFQVQNGSNYGVMTVDTSGNQVVLGNAAHLSGKISFADSGDSNTISLIAPSSVAASYSLTLPTNTPTAGLCLGTSPSNANQLIFASCATQVSAASITYVNQWSNSGTSITTLSDLPSNTGDLLVLYSHAANNVSINSVYGGGVTNWTKVTSNVGGTGQGNNEMWRGVVTSSGSATITVNYSAAAGANEITSQEYTMGGTGGGTWAIDTSGVATGTSTAINYPSLTPANSSELYAGYAWSANTMAAGTTTGYTYTATNSGKYTVYNTSVSGGVAAQPTASQTVSGVYNSIAAVIQAYAGTSVIVNSTATQQANFNVQAALSGTVAGVLQGANSSTADVLQVKDGSGLNIMTVNTSNINGADGVTLGSAGSTGGQLTFNSSGNTNSITIEAPPAPGASYYLKLPTTTPAPGQCLATSPSDQNQLTFSSCANQVTSIAINLVNNWEANPSGNTVILAVSPTTAGDLMTLFIYSSKGNSVTNVQGGGVTSWSKLVAANSEEMWRGVVTSTGSSNITVTVSSPSGPTVELAAQEWGTGSATGSWVVDTSGTISNASSTTVTYPSLTPQSTKDLYIGYAIGTSAMSGSPTTGYTYFAGAGADMRGAYNTSVSTTTQPTASQSGTGTSIAAAALIAAYSSSSVISNSTVTQEGNFNVQAATSGSVAGTLQAFPTGTADIFDLLDGNGNLVGSVGYTGNMLVRPSTASAAAFQVQTTGNANVLSVDTNSKLVVVGAGAAGESSPSLLVVDSETGTSADPTEVDGAIYYNATTRAFRCGVAGAWQNCGGLLYSNTSKSSVNSNCSSSCVAFSTAAAMPGGFCQAGKVIKMSAEGIFSSQASATNLQFGIYYGTDGSVAGNDTLIGSLSPAVSVTSASNNYFDMEFNITCFSSTSMQAGGVLNLQVGSSSSGLTPFPMNAVTASTVVTSSSENLYIFPVWSAASVSNTAQITQFSVTSP